MKSMMLAVVLVATALVVSVVPSGAATITVTASPLWTNSGITVAASDTVTFSGATGTWNFGNGPVGPGGIAWEAIYDEWITNQRQGQLIGFIGTAGDLNIVPRLIAQNDSRLFEIGTHTVVISGMSGQVWLGFNDAYVTGPSDNSGTVVVEVSVAEPGTMLLLGSGLLGLLGMAGERWKSSNIAGN